MFTNKKLEEEHRGKHGSPRVEYLQELVNKFQNTKDEEVRERIAANLANFAYDPYNYMFLRQLNVLELFLDCITEPNVKLMEFGIGGICNSCVDPMNAKVVIQCGGIQAILRCLERDEAGGKSVQYSIGALYYLCSDISCRNEILSPEVLVIMRRHAAASGVCGNLARAFLDLYG